MNQLSLKARFTICMIVMLLPIISLAAGSFFTMAAVIESLNEVVEEAKDEMHPVMKLQILIQDSAMPVHDYLLHGNRTERELFFIKSRQVDTFFSQLLNHTFELAEEQALLRTARQGWKDYRDNASKLFELKNPAGNQDGIARMEKLDIQMDKLIATLSENHSVIINEMNEHLDRSHDIRVFAFMLNSGIFIIGIVLAVTSSLVLSRSIISPVNKLKEATNTFGEGDLTARVDLEGGDEFVSLATAFNAMAIKLEESQNELKEMASRDALTRLYNHGEFYRRVKMEIKRSQRYGHALSILILDLDNLKEINDKYGHQAGDRALQNIASLIVRAARPVDTAARYGGDEFSLILPETSHMNALTMAERIRTAIAEHEMSLHPSEKKIIITTSIGASSYPEDGTNEHDLIAMADKALYNAKNMGRNRVCCYREL